MKNKIIIAIVALILLGARPCVAQTKDDLLKEGMELQQRHIEYSKIVSNIEMRLVEIKGILKFIQDNEKEKELEPKVEADKKD